MALESATWVVQLDTANPQGSDPRSQGDDHLRLLKDVLKGDLSTANRQWLYTGHSVVWSTSTSITIDGDQTTDYETDRRVKMVGASTGTIYGYISSSTFSVNTAINFTFDSGTLTNESPLTPYLSLLTASNPASPKTSIEATSTGAIITGSEIELDNSASVINADLLLRNSEGGVRLRSDGDNFSVFQTDTNGTVEKTLIQFNNNGSTEINFDGTEKLKSTSQGVSISKTAAELISGTGTPEGNVTAAIGSIFMRTDGGAGTTVYAKESGSGNTGWSAL